MEVSFAKGWEIAVRAKFPAGCVRFGTRPLERL